MKPSFLRMAAVAACLPLLCVRAANPTVLSPEASRAITMENARQEMIEARLDELLYRFQELALDLRSNPGAGGDAGKQATEFQSQLEQIKSNDLAQARTDLRQAAASPSNAMTQCLDARSAIDRASRELASLLLHAGTSPAADAFAREIRDVIERQENLQRDTLEAAETGAATTNPQTPSAGPQKELSTRLDKLVAEVAALPPAETDAMAAVRIARARKEIESGKAPGTLLAAAGELDHRSFAGAATRQGSALSVLRQAEIKLRADATLQGLVRARDLLQQLLEGQKSLQNQTGTLAAAEFHAQRNVLERRERSLALPLAQLDSRLRLEDFTKTAGEAVAKAGDRLAAGDQAGSGARQQEVVDALNNAIANLEQRIADAQGVSTAYKHLQEATGRSKMVQDIDDRQEQVSDDAQTALLEKKDTGPMADLEGRLAAEIAKFGQGLPAGNKWTSALQRPLKRAAKSASAAAAALKNKQSDKAKNQFAAASTAMEEAVDLGKKEVDYLDKTWTLMQLAGDMKTISQSLGDITDEQRDLQTQSQGADAAGAVDKLSATQSMLAKALDEITQLAEPIMEAAPMKPYLDQAAHAMGDASSRLNAGQPAAAAPFETNAVDGLQKARKFASDLAVKADYLAKWAASLEQFSADAADLLERQIELRETTQDADLNQFASITGEQDTLKGETDVMSGVVVQSAAQQYHIAGSEMGLAIEQLKTQQRDPAVQHQMLAEKALRAGMEELQKALAAIMQEMTQPLNIDPATGLDPLSALLFLAIQEKDLRDATLATREGDLPQLGPKQEEIHNGAAQLTGISTMAMAADLINDAMKEMEQVTPLLAKPDRQPAAEHERLAEKALRMAFAKVAISLYILPQPGDPVTSAEMKGDPDAIPFNSMDHWATFMKGSPGGADVNRDKAQWESLTDRDRAALNENFARELPLEYRKLLNDYYEALSK